MHYTIGRDFEDQAADQLFVHLRQDAKAICTEDDFSITYDQTCDHDGEGYHGYTLYRHQRLPYPGLLRRLLRRLTRRTVVMTLHKDNSAPHYRYLHVYDLSLMPIAEGRFKAFTEECQLTDTTIELNDYHSLKALSAARESRSLMHDSDLLEYLSSAPEDVGRRAPMPEPAAEPRRQTFQSEILRMVMDIFTGARWTTREEYRKDAARRDLRWRKTRGRNR